MRRQHPAHLERWAADKLTQLVFCDISTPQGASGQFTVYDDLRRKLVRGGIPKEQVAFIHEPTPMHGKKRCLLKCARPGARPDGKYTEDGGGHQVQDRLIAMHDLDCPWRPRDLTQRKGRIERQGNCNPLVHVYRYVTEGHLRRLICGRTVEKKQQFISQIMTSKSPARSCEDVDATALSFAEIKALCAGDPRIKERMELDVDVTRLKLLKSDYMSKHYRMEDNLLNRYPKRLRENRELKKALEADLALAEQHPHPKDGFAGMTIGNWAYQDRTSAGEALLALCSEVKGDNMLEAGHYRGFTVLLCTGLLCYKAILKGSAEHSVELGQDAKGNLVRIDHVLDRLSQRIQETQDAIEHTLQQCEAAKAELEKPFPQEAELAEKSARLTELDILLHIGDQESTDRLAG